MRKQRRRHERKRVPWTRKRAEKGNKNKWERKSNLKSRSSMFGAKINNLEREVSSLRTTEWSLQERNNRARIYVAHASLLSAENETTAWFSVTYHILPSIENSWWTTCDWAIWTLELYLSRWYEMSESGFAAACCRCRCGYRLKEYPPVVLTLLCI